MSFTFDNVHSAAMGVYVKSIDRTLLPPKRVTQYTVPGKSGTYDIDNGYGNRNIICEIGFAGDDCSKEALRQKARTVAQWLSGSGRLIFDDEPNKEYEAKVIAGISITEVVRTGKCQVTFQCNPFAFARQYSKAVAKGVSLPHVMDIHTDGTQETPCTVYITAKGNIDSITIDRLTFK